MWSKITVVPIELLMPAGIIGFVKILKIEYLNYLFKQHQ